MSFDIPRKFIGKKRTNLVLNTIIRLIDGWNVSLTFIISMKYSLEMPQRYRNSKSNCPDLNLKL